MYEPQKKIKRINSFLKLNIKSVIFGLRPTQLFGRINGPKVLVNSFPKAGTNLLENLLLNVPGLRRRLGRMNRAWTIEEVNSILNNIKSLKKGQFTSSHFIADERIFNTLKINNIKSIMVIRDIRSKIISHSKYVTNIDFAHKTHNFFKNLDDDDNRINAIIDGVPNVVASIDEELKRYAGWLDNPHILVVRFEDLIGEMGGGSDNKQKETLEKIINFLEVKISNNQFNKIQSKIFSTKVRTFRSGKINEWHKYLNENHKNKIKNKAGNWLIENGYEKNNDW